MVIVDTSTWDILVPDGEFKDNEIEAAVKKANKNLRSRLRIKEQSYEHMPTYFNKAVLLAMYNASLEVMSIDEYTKRKRRFYLGNELVEVDSIDWDSLYNSLKEAKLSERNSVKMLTEIPLDDSYAKQYAVCNHRYYSKMVDLNDETTWIYNFLNKDGSINSEVYYEYMNEISMMDSSGNEFNSMGAQLSADTAKHLCDMLKD